MQGRSLLRGASGEIDTSLDVGLESLDGFIEKLLLIVVGAGENVDGFLSTIRLGKGQ